MPATVRALIAEDYVTHRRQLHSPGLHALAVYRLRTAAAGSSGLWARLLRPVLGLAGNFVAGVYGIELPASARIGRRLFLPHPQGVVLVAGCVIGDDCMIRHNVTVGAGSDTRGGLPTIGDRVQFGPGSIVMGAVQVGDDVLIGPSAVVVTDVPAGSRLLAPAAQTREPRSRGAETSAEREPPL